MVMIRGTDTEENGGMVCREFTYVCRRGKIKECSSGTEGDDITS
jgi:hypothetical protein